MSNGKISRKELYKYMDIGSDFNILGIKEKLEHILKKIVLFEELYDKLDLLSSESYELSERQLRTRELINVNIKNNDIVQAYCEFLDYIDDYGKDHNDTINVTELLDIKPALLELKQFILKKYFEVDAKLNDFIIDSNFVERITVKKEEVKWLTEEEVNNLKVKYNNFESTKAISNIIHLNNNDTIKINIFGEEKNLRVFSTGDNKFDENGYYKENPNFELTKEEIDMLNWFVNNVKIEDYQKEIVDYCNNSYSEWCDKKITEEELPSEIKIDSIAINIKEKNKLLDEKYNIPEIAFFGECSCDEEHGICIGFKNGKCIGIESQDWIL